MTQSKPPSVRTRIDELIRQSGKQIARESQVIRERAAWLRERARRQRERIHHEEHKP